MYFLKGGFFFCYSMSLCRYVVMSLCRYVVIKRAPNMLFSNAVIVLTLFIFMIRD